MMSSQDFISSVLVDETILTIDELACACVVERKWIIQHVQEGLINCVSADITSNENEWRFAAVDLARARKLLWFERDFDVNPDVAALLADLLEEISTLKRRLSD